MGFPINEQKYSLKKNSIELVSDSPQETFNTGKQFAAHLSQGSIVALEGTLGSGKTCLVKGIAHGLGIKENLTSPTFTIINEYHKDCGILFYHIDAYRLNGDKDFEDIGGPEIINSDGISVIEWSERLPKSIPAKAITVSLEITGNFSRIIRIKGAPFYESSGN